MNGVLTEEQLAELVEAYSDFPELVVDVETRGPYMGDPHRNEVFWISLAGPGRADAIPCGHPLGSYITYPADDELHRINKNGRHQERQMNETTGRLNWVNVDPPHEPPPKQLWISDVIEAIRPLFFDGKRTIIGQNIKFDMESLYKYFGAVTDNPMADTLVAAKLLDENYLPGQYRLGELVKREFGFTYDKLGSKGVDNYSYDAAHLYSYLDAKWTWLLWQRYKERLIKHGLMDLFGIEMQLLPVIIDMEIAGVPIDKKALAGLGEEFSMEMTRHQLAIDRKAGKPVNLNANLQVAEFVYDTLGHECTVFTKKTGARSTTSATIDEFSFDPYVARLQDYAKLNKLQGTFVDGISRTLDHGRVHASFNQAGTVSGRISCNSPNLQQIPSRSERGKRVRDVFVASPGHVLVVSDLSQIELRMLAHLTQDRGLVSAYRKGLDLHAQTAQQIFGDDSSKYRSMAKSGNFSVLFGAFPRTLVVRYGFPSIKVAKKFLDGFYDTYPRVALWKREVLTEAAAKGKRGTPPYVETLLGRRRRLPELRHHDEYTRQAAERQAISVTISGSAADLFKVAMVNVHAALQQQDWEGHILMTVHDELVVEVPEEHGEEGLELVKYWMENVDDPWTGEPLISIPLIAEAKVVGRWSDGK